MNALTAVINADSVTRSDAGSSFAPSAEQSPRLLESTFSETTAQFLQQVEQWPVQALEYKSFLRFKVGSDPRRLMWQPATAAAY